MLFRSGCCGSVLVYLIPALRGTGIVLAPVPKMLLMMAGTDDCLANRCGNNGNSERLYFGGSKITADGNHSHEIQDAYSLEEKL